MAELDLGNQFSGTESMLEVSSTIAYLEEEELGTGFLSINEQTLDWTSSSGDNVKLCFPYIAVHAVSREASVFPYKPCIFILYSVPDEDDPEQEVTKEYRFSTEETEQLDRIFEAITECQRLYPDSELSSDSDEESNTLEGGYFTTIDGLQHLSLEGQSVLNHLEHVIQQSEGHHRSIENGNGADQFDDADTT